MGTSTVTIVIIAIVAAAAAAFLSTLITTKTLKRRREQMLKEAENEGEMIKKEKILQAKERYIQLKAEHDKLVNERNNKLSQAEQRLKQQEAGLQKKEEQLTRATEETQNAKRKFELQSEAIEKRREEFDKLQKEQIQRLEQVSNMTSEEAKNILIEMMKSEAQSEATTYINDIIDDAKMTANKEAKRIVINTIQRVATETAIENSVTVFNIDSDEVKGRIIGREGRNIRALEAATGVEIVVDDTPEAIILSAFDPVRREIARLALHQLVTDGRIHPARIEEVVAKVRKQIEEEIVEVGKRTAIDLGIHALHPELIRLIGKNR